MSRLVSGYSYTVDIGVRTSQTPKAQESLPHHSNHVGTLFAQIQKIHEISPAWAIACLWVTGWLTGSMVRWSTCKLCAAAPGWVLCSPPLKPTPPALLYSSPGVKKVQPALIYTCEAIRKKNTPWVLSVRSRSRRYKQEKKNWINIGGMCRCAAVDVMVGSCGVCVGMYCSYVRFLVLQVNSSSLWLHSWIMNPAAHFLMTELQITPPHPLLVFWNSSLLFCCFNLNYPLTSISAAYKGHVRMDCNSCINMIRNI